MWTLVTGGTKGIGQAISQHIHHHTKKVIAVYHTDDTQAKDFTQRTDIPAYRWDVSDLAQCQKNIKRIQDHHGTITKLVNNAGVIQDALFENMTLDQWNYVMHTNVNSLFAMTKSVWPIMQELGGSIVNVSSVNGIKGQRGQTNYCASKAAILGFTKALALEGAPHNIRVNAIAPGYIDTPMIQSVPEKIQASIIKNIPLKRWGTPLEIAEAVWFLLSSSYTTGATLHSNGGQWMG